MEVGNFEEGFGGFRVGGIFFDEALVSGDGGRDVAAVGFGLADAVVGEEDFVVGRIFFGELGHQTHDFVGVLRGAGELGALEVGEGGGLALGEFFGEGRHAGDGFVVAAEGEEGGGGRIHGAGGE